MFEHTYHTILLMRIVSCPTQESDADRLERCTCEKRSATENAKSI